MAEAPGALVIGGASGFWGEARHATRQLLDSGPIDFLAYDFLAEITMSILARARAKDAALGYATDFPAILQPVLPELAERRVRVISNAGGVNPDACGAALRDAIAAAGLSLKVAVVTGDDLTDQADRFAAEGVREMFSDAPFPSLERIASVNAYLGAFPIAAALDRGADIVVTGRCVDSAVTLGACIHRFGWGVGDFDKLAAGALAGHLIECGPQVCGGNFTDWRAAGDISDIGYPLAEISADGATVIRKPERTTGVVNRLTVAEQMLYEIGDPRAYLLPDVTCDFSQVSLVETGPDTVRATGARGSAPTGGYKVSATFEDGFRAGSMWQFTGFEARAKAEAFGAAAVARARRALRDRNAPDFDEISVEVLGGETGAAPGFEAVCVAISARHRESGAVGALLRESTGLALGAPSGLSGFSGAGRPKPSPVVRLFSFLAPKDRVSIAIDLGQGPRPFSIETPPSSAVAQTEETQTATPADLEDSAIARPPLIELAAARSGDKGDKANIGVIARKAAFLPYIWAALTEEAIAEIFARFSPGPVRRFLLPGSASMNILIDRVLGGGGVASLRLDPQAKSYGQILLARPIPIPARLLAAQHLSENV